ncbi:Beta-lactamase domain protein [Candidatus Nitrosocosmicus arcticus]|uniref:Beta-lactamase domain protein n=2 Tax=Candidatus Nitrosocosmicus arcticus TaxID=2035267 RepID=A0A557SSN8_9ARCH|nr:Beta-lactamase domain protein [Candidatus Nitrosocosmicus arcticus]
MYSRSFESSQNLQESQSVMATILQNLPKECSLTKIEYEGPRIALHTNKPQFLLENNKILSNIVGQIKKRIVLRIDETIRIDESEVQKVAEKHAPQESGITEILFDPALGEATIFVKNISEIIKDEKIINNIILESGWKISFKKIPKNMVTIKNINKIIRNASDYRIQFYKRIGEKIFREKLDPNIEANLNSLGGFAEIGRSSMILSTNESNVLLDCGMNIYTKDPLSRFPRFDSTGIKLSEIDAVLLTHAHFDHTGFLPMLFKYGYDGPVYCTEPTSYLMYILYREYIRHSGSEAHYTDKELEKIFSHLIHLNYNIVTDVSPDIKVTFYNAGHVIGSSSFHLHIGNGDHNFVYTGDIKFGKSSYLENAVWNFPRVETLLIEGTNGGREDSYSSREDAQERLIEVINKVIKNQKLILMPAQLIGTSQELLITLDMLIKQKKIMKCKLYIEKLVTEINSIHEFNVEFLNRELQQSIISNDYNPFRSKNIASILDITTQKLDPGIIIYPSSMLNCSYSKDYLKRISNDPGNLIIFTSKPTGMTLGKEIIDGQRKLSINDEDFEIRCAIETMYSFNSHSDFNQLNAYISRLRPKLRKILVNHGERSKVQNFSGYSSKVHNISTQYLQNQESIKLL